MNYLFEAIHGICNIFTFYLLFSVFLEQKPKWKPSLIFTLLILLGACYNALGAFILVTLPTYFLQVLLSGINTVGACFATMMPLRGSIKQKISLTVSVLALASVAEYAAIAITPLLTGQPVTPNLDDWLERNAIITLASMILLSIVVGIRLFKLYGRKLFKSGQSHWLELIIPGVSLLVTCYHTYLMRQDALIVSTLVFLTNVLAFLVYDLYYRKAREYEMRERQQKLRETHYNELENHQAEIRAIKHDMKNQLIAMGAFVKSGDTERADTQLGALIRQLEENSNLLFTDNAGVNGLLARKYKNAGEQGIQCDFKITLPATTGFADADLTALLGNILDNALEACMHCDGRRSIRLEILSEDDVLIIRSENSTDGKVQSIKTRKKDPLRHGIGMESIKQVVDKYNGQMEYHFSGNHFTIELSLFPNE